MQQKWMTSDYNALESRTANDDDEHERKCQLKEQTQEEITINLNSGSCSSDVELAECEQSAALKLPTIVQTGCEEDDVADHDVQDNFLPRHSIALEATEQLKLSTATTSMPRSIIFKMYKSIQAASIMSSSHVEIPNGSNHGLSPQSAEQIQWAHAIPYHIRPAIPALFNLLNSALRWASLVYIDASVAEMLISGLELTLSVVAARVIRKRMVSRSIDGWGL